jgi:hypothetical protein
LAIKPDLLPNFMGKHIKRVGGSKAHGAEPFSFTKADDNLMKSDSQIGACMDMKMITAWFSREKLGGLVVGAAIAMVLPGSPALADQIVGTFSSPSGGVSYGVGGPTAVINMPVAPVSNVDPMAANAGVPSLGDSGSGANSSYKTGEAPEDAGMSGLSATNTSNPAQNPTLGPGTNYGLSQMTNGLMGLSPTSINLAPIPSAGFTDGFPSPTGPKIYGMDLSNNPIQGLVNGLINGLGGGIITSGPVLPVTSTSSVNANVTMGNGY